MTMINRGSRTAPFPYAETELYPMTGEFDMKKYLYSKELPIYRDVDVLVVGAGPAGMCAAVCAARQGARTLVFDLNGCVGGQATVGLVGPFMTSYDSKNQYMVIRGIFEEIVERMKALGGAIDPGEVEAKQPLSGFYSIGHAHVGPFDHECLKRVGADMILESGAELLLNTQFIDVIQRGEHLDGVIIANKSGMSVIRAKIIIDCSGDADVAARAGVGFELGNVSDGNIQAATLFFRVGNVDTARLKAHMAEHQSEIKPFYGPFSWLIREKADEWDVPRGEICMFEGTNPGEYRMNVTRILHCDGTNAEDLTRGEIEGMHQAHKVFDFLKKYAIGFENAVFLDTADTLGIRETRHIDGIRRLTVDDVKVCAVPEDSIAVMATNMDTHNKDDEGGTYYTHTAGPYFGVPYGCLVARGIDNLMVAGRSISTDAVAGSATRMIPCCMVFGQAAGTAAALAVQKGISPADVNVPELQDNLRGQGAYLGD